MKNLIEEMIQLSKEEHESNTKNSSIERCEENRKIRRIIRRLEDWDWHPHIQKQVKMYCEGIIENELRLQKKEHFIRSLIKYQDGKLQTLSDYFHNIVTKELFRYQDAVNTVCYNYEYNISIRKKLIIFLDPKCVYCGNEDIDLLNIDHTTNNGSQDRQWAKYTKLNLFSFYWNNLADAYMNLQVLCIKCHRLKTRRILTQNLIEEKLNNEVKKLKKNKK